MEVTAFYKKYIQKWKVFKEKNLPWIGKSVPRDHCLASLGKPSDAK